MTPCRETKHRSKLPRAEKGKKKTLEASREEVRHMAAGGSGGPDESIKMRAELIEKAFAVAWEAHKSPEKHYLLEKISGSNPPETIISFPASGTFMDWYSERTFGETEIDRILFPSLESIANKEAALVNEYFLRRFKDILAKSSLRDEVYRAMTNQEQIVFVGHSSGGPVAMLATLWALENHLTPQSLGGISPLCVTFGSPLVGNHIFSHATRRKNWSRFFTHFVMRYDVVPRILLAPLSSFGQRFEPVSQLFDPKSKSFMGLSVFETATATSGFYFAVMSNVCTVTSHAACKLMCSTETIVETLANFNPLSPYRPFGTYIFCTANGKEGKQIVIRNPNSVLQLMFFSAQLSTEAEAPQVSYRSLREHLIYGTELRITLAMQNVVYLDQVEKPPLSDEDCRKSESKESQSNDDEVDIAMINTVSNALGLSTRARLSLLAAAEFEKGRRKNGYRIEREIKTRVQPITKKMENYIKNRELGCDVNGRHPEIHFQAYVLRLELDIVWHKIIEKLRNYELPDEFESQKEWIELGTRIRLLVETFDITKDYAPQGPGLLGILRLGPHETRSYIYTGGPERHRYPQKWLEHAQVKQVEANWESSFWAEVEDPCDISNENTNLLEILREGLRDWRIKEGRVKNGDLEDCNRQQEDQAPRNRPSTSNPSASITK